MKKKELLSSQRARNGKRPYGAFIMLLFFTLFLNVQNIYSQEKTITGTLKDEAGEPLPSAFLLEKGTNNGTQTEEDALKWKTTGFKQGRGRWDPLKFRGLYHARKDYSHCC
jgi:hypothetical protein